MPEWVTCILPDASGLQDGTPALSVLLRHSARESRQA